MGLREYLSAGHQQSAMRLMAFLCVVTACISAIGAVSGFVVGVILGRDMTMLGAAIGGIAGIIGALLVPAFGGKAAQSFAELKKPDDQGGAK